MSRLTAVFTLLLGGLIACSDPVPRGPGGGNGGLPTDTGTGDGDGSTRDADPTDTGQAPPADASMDVGVSMLDSGASDAGTSPDQGAQDAGFADASTNDSGESTDATSGFDAGGGLFDGSFPSFDGSFPSFDGGVFQTTVSFVPGTTQVFMNLQPAVPPDPLRLTAELQYDNAGPGDEPIDVISARVTLISAMGGFVQQTFDVQPNHVAPVGTTTKQVSKVLGSGSAPIMNPQAFCMTPALLRLELSSGQVLLDFPTVGCVF